MAEEGGSSGERIANLGVRMDTSSLPASKEVAVKNINDIKLAAGGLVSAMEAVDASVAVAAKATVSSAQQAADAIMASDKMIADSAAKTAESIRIAYLDNQIQLLQMVNAGIITRQQYLDKISQLNAEAAAKTKALMAETAGPAYTPGQRSGATAFAGPIPGVLTEQETAAGAAVYDRMFDKVTPGLKEMQQSIREATADFDKGIITAEQYADSLGVVKQQAVELTRGVEMTSAQTKEYKAVLASTTFSAVAMQLGQMKDAAMELNAQFKAGIISQQEYKAGLAAIKVEAQALAQKAGSMSQGELSQLNGVLGTVNERAQHGSAQGLRQMSRSMFAMALQGTETNSKLGQLAQGMLLFGFGSTIMVAIAAGLLAAIKLFEWLNSTEVEASKRQEELTKSLKAYQEQLDAGTPKEVDNLNFLQQRIDKLKEAKKAAENNPAGPAGNTDPFTVFHTISLQESARLQGEITKLTEVEALQRQKVIEARDKDQQSELASYRTLISIGQDTAADRERLLAIQAKMKEQLAEELTTRQSIAAVVATTLNIQGLDVTRDTETPKELADRAKALADIKAITEELLNPLKQVRAQIAGMVLQDDATRVAALNTQIANLKKAATEAHLPVAELDAAIGSMRKKLADEQYNKQFQLSLQGPDMQNLDVLEQMAGEASRRRQQASAGSQQETDATVQLAEVSARINALLAQRVDLHKQIGAEADEEVNGQQVVVNYTTRRIQLLGQLNSFMLTTHTLTTKTNEGLTTAQQNTLKWANEVLKVASGLTQIVNSFGGISQGLNQALTGVINLGSIIANTFKVAADAGKSFFAALTTGDWIQAAGSVVGIIGSLFSHGPSQQDIESKRIATDNTNALKKLTDTIGEFGLAISGNQFVRGQAGVNALLGAGIYRPGPRGGNAGDKVHMDQINAALAGTGESYQQLVDLAKTLGITLDTSSVRKFMDSLTKLNEAIKATELTRFTQTFAGQMQALNASFSYFNITDPVKKLKQMVEVFTNLENLQTVKGADGKDTVVNLGGEGSPALKDALKGLDLSLQKDRDKAQQNLDKLFKDLVSGKITAAQLGGLDAQQFLDALQQLKQTLRDATAQTSGQDTRGFAIDRTITDQQGDQIAGLMLSNNIILRSHTDLLNRVANASEDGAVALMALTKTAAVAASPPAAADVVQATGALITIDTLTVQASSPEAGAAAAEAFVGKVNELMGVKVRQSQLLIGGNATLTKTK
jgi:hypothetical protein